MLLLQRFDDRPFAAAQRLRAKLAGTQDDSP
jgi:hypothetical protein